MSEILPAEKEEKGILGRVHKKYRGLSGHVNDSHMLRTIQEV